MENKIRNFFKYGVKRGSASWKFFVLGLVIYFIILIFFLLLFHFRNLLFLIIFGVVFLAGQLIIYFGQTPLQRRRIGFFSEGVVKGEIASAYDLKEYDEEYNKKVRKKIKESNKKYLENFIKKGKK